MPAPKTMTFIMVPILNPKALSGSAWRHHHPSPSLVRISLERASILRHVFKPLMRPKNLDEAAERSFGQGRDIDGNIVMETRPISANAFR